VIQQTLMNDFIAQKPLDFPLDMLQRMHLEADPVRVGLDFGFDYDTIKELPHFKAKMQAVEQALLVEGALTPVIAGIGLHAAVEKLAFRVQDDRVSTGDLVKAIETFKKVKDGSKSEDTKQIQQGVSLIINIPAIGETPAKTIEVTSSPNTIEHDADSTPPTITFTESDFKIEVPSV